MSNNMLDTKPYVGRVNTSLALPGYYESTPKFEPTPTVDVDNLSPEQSDETYHAAPYSPKPLSLSDDTLFSYDFVFNDEHTILDTAPTPEKTLSHDTVLAVKNTLAGIALGASIVGGTAFLSAEQNRTPEQVVYTVPSDNEAVPSIQTSNNSPSIITIYNQYTNK